jgi:hypothetical protein
MKDFFKLLLILLAASSAFWIGFYLGGEGVKNKYPDFQKESEEDHLD